MPRSSRRVSINREKRRGGKGKRANKAAETFWTLPNAAARLAIAAAYTPIRTDRGDICRTGDHEETWSPNREVGDERVLSRERPRWAAKEEHTGCVGALNGGKGWGVAPHTSYPRLHFYFHKKSNWVSCSHWDSCEGAVGRDASQNRICAGYSGLTWVAFSQRESCADLKKKRKAPQGTRPRNSARSTVGSGCHLRGRSRGKGEKQRGYVFVNATHMGALSRRHLSTRPPPLVFY